MTDFEFIWDEQPGGNVEHIAANDLKPEDVEFAFDTVSGHDISRSSGRPIIYGLALDGREIVVVYDVIAERTIYVVTAYEPS